MTFLNFIGAVSFESASKFTPHPRAKHILKRPEFLMWKKNYHEAHEEHEETFKTRILRALRDENIREMFASCCHIENCC
jgi:hypothetical protein